MLFIGMNLEFPGAVFDEQCGSQTFPKQPSLEAQGTIYFFYKKCKMPHAQMASLRPPNLFCSENELLNFHAQSLMKLIYSHRVYK